MTDPAELQAIVQAVVAPWVSELELRVVEARDGEVVLELPVTPRHVHAGGVLCGQTLMAAADTSMILAVATRLGGFKPMTTVQLQTSFLKPVPGDAGHVRLVATLLRLGRNLAFGEVRVRGPRDELVAHATTSYALL